MLMNGAALKSIDRQEQLFLLAWAIRQAKAKKKSGRYFYRTFKQFFNRKKIESQIMGKKDISSLSSKIQKAMELAKSRERE